MKLAVLISILFAAWASASMQQSPDDVPSPNAVTSSVDSDSISAQTSDGTTPPTSEAAAPKPAGPSTAEPSTPEPSTGGPTATEPSTGHSTAEPPIAEPSASEPSVPGTAEVGESLGQSAAPSTAQANEPRWLNDIPTNALLGAVLVTLAIASLIGQWLRNQPSESINPALVRRFRQRLNSWWLMCAILVFGLLLRPIGTVILFGLVSFWALREFITMAPTRRGDHRALFWALIVFTPLQYVLIALSLGEWRWASGKPIDFYGLYSILIPVYASLMVPARIAISGDHKRFLERSAQITVGLLICVYSLSYAPALLDLELTTSSGVPWNGSVAGLLFFFILVSQLSDIFQWSWGQLVGKTLIAADVSASRTWEGFAGGTLCTGLLGALLYWATPFQIWEAACMSMIVAVMGMCGGMTMSAIKRDRGVTDYGSLVLGHAGVLDRIDTLCFAAPVFYHLMRFFFSA
ncbi:MAG: phosphatidate cytidylyltransferase [Pirellulaceae bacterium]|nr:phosphatidate cytidylyltransferase [Pirellulaceae bacterium]